MENKIMTKERTHWVFVVNALHGRLLHCCMDSLGHCYVEEVDRIENNWEGRERGRPSPLSDKAGHAYASQGHGAQEDLCRFAREVANWLELQTSFHRMDSSVLFAPPRFLGAIRKCKPKGFSHHVDARQGDLAGLEEQELSNHPAVRQVAGHAVSTAVR